jgi:hypothetical protein
MKNKQVTYRGKMHWWGILILWGFYVHMIFAYIHQWGNNPVNGAALVIFAIIWIMISVLLFSERFILTIDDEFVKFKYYGDPVKIHVTQIKDVSVEKMSFFKIYAKLYQYYDFTGQFLKIQTKSGRIYQFAIRDAQKIKEEIEKRMKITNTP